MNYLFLNSCLRHLVKIKTCIPTLGIIGNLHELKKKILHNNSTVTLIAIRLEMQLVKLSDLL